MSKFCENCGKEIKNENQDVCLKCGSAIREVNYVNQNNIVISDDEKREKNAMIGFILGLVSIIAWIIPLFGYPVSICGIVFSAKGLNSNINKGKAITGLILSIVFIVITFINSFLGALMTLV